MVVTPPKSTEVMAGQPQKAPSPKLVTLLGIVMRPKASFVEHIKSVTVSCGLTYRHWVMKPPPSLAVSIVISSPGPWTMPS